MPQNSRNESQTSFSREAIVRALFETYESLYDIDVETSAYRCYHESNSFSELQIESSGEDFFKAVIENIPQTVCVEDQEYVRAMLRREAVLAALEKEKHYSFVYRLMLGALPVYHKIRATMETVSGRKHIMIGVRNVDETIRQEQTHMGALAAMYQKERNHIEAILASAAGYLEVNLTRDRILEYSPYFMESGGVRGVKIPLPERPSSYSRLEQWLGENLVSEGKELYGIICDCTYLIQCFERGDRRASVYFSVRTNTGEVKPCKKIFYLYRDDTSGDVMSFCVIYDLTEEQQREQEVRDLEDKLRMSRIRNSTSQMQPHFLYNALGSIQEVVLDDPEYAYELIGDFTVHLRSCIRAMANDAPLPFEQELDNIRAYVSIEKMRFGDKLRVAYQIGTKSFSILPLSIQPLVENAIRHGIYRRGAQGGTVTIRSMERPDSWVVEVEDDGVGFDVAALRAEVEAGKRDSTGLKNITFRLEQVMRAGVEIESTPERGTKVVVTIPKGGAAG